MVIKIKNEMFDNFYFKKKQTVIKYLYDNRKG